MKRPFGLDYLVRLDPNWRQKPERTCDIYMAMARDRDGPMYVKVGVSTHPEARLSGIQTSCPMPLLRALTFTCRSSALARAGEAAMHLHLRDHAARGEWFRFEWCDASKVLLESALNALIEEVDGRDLRQIDLTTLAQSVLARKRDVEHARAARVAAALDKHRVAVELRTPRKRE